MAQEVVDSILEPEAPAPDLPTEFEGVGEDETTYLANLQDPEDDTYVNNGDVRDMDE
ncbi:hypothetical protein [Larkinella arboricola]